MVDKITPGTPLIDQLGIQNKKTEDVKGKDQLGQKEFLDLMIAQFQNQSPTEPMENGDFIAQMAQFSMVSGLSDIKQSFDGLSAALVSNQALQASSMVGRKVLVPSDSGDLSDKVGEGLSGGVELLQSTNDLTISIHDNSGQLIKRIELGAQSSGMAKFNWDGKNENGDKMSPGTYKVTAEARTPDGPQAIGTFIAAVVESVSLGGAGQNMKLNVAGQGSLSFGSIRELL